MTKSSFKMLGCALVGVQAVEANTQHTFPRHTHDQFGIGAIERGAQKSRSGRGLVEAACGDTITCNPREVHDGAPVGDAGRAWPMLYFDTDVVANLASDISSGGAMAYEFHRPVMRDARVAARFHQLFVAMTHRGAMHTESTEPLAQENLLMMLAALLPELDTLEKKQSAPAAISRARSLIDDDPCALITLADLARHSGLSRFQVVRGFAKTTGLTPHAYLVQCRIHVARRLIARGTRLAEAAAACGFSDQSHMTRIFVRKYGVSPRAYGDALS